MAVAAIFFATQPSLSQTAPKPATEATRAANRKALESLNFENRDDFDNAARGFIAKPDVLTIKDSSGAPVWVEGAVTIWSCISQVQPRAMW